MQGRQISVESLRQHSRSIVRRFQHVLVLLLEQPALHARRRGLCLALNRLLHIRKGSRQASQSQTQVRGLRPLHELLQFPARDRHGRDADLNLDDRGSLVVLPGHAGLCLEGKEGAFISILGNLQSRPQADGEGKSAVSLGLWDLCPRLPRRPIALATPHRFGDALQALHVLHHHSLHLIERQLVDGHLEPFLDLLVAGLVWERFRCFLVQGDRVFVDHRRLRWQQGELACLRRRLLWMQDQFHISPKHRHAQHP